MMHTMEGATRLTMSDINGQPAGQMDPRYRSRQFNEPIVMSKSLPVNGLRSRAPRDDVLHSSQSLTGRSSVMTYNHKQYPSASAALSDYISDYESQKSSQDSQSQSSYRRTVSDLLLPKTSLQKTVQRSLDTGVRDTKDEFHRFNIRKLIDDSYEQILRADLEQGKASAIVATAKHLGSESTLSFEDTATYEKEFSDIASEISSSTDALLLANPYVVNFSQKDRKLHHGGASSVRRSKSMESTRLPMSSSYVRQRLSKSSGRMDASKQHMHPTSHQLKDHRPQESFDSTTILQTSHRGVPSPKHSVYDRRQEVRRSVPSRIDGRPVPAWVSDLNNSVASQKRLDTLYTDSLLSADGHGLSHQDSLRQSQQNRTSLISGDQDQRMHSLSLQDQLEERSVSVMSGMRPPPTWVEDLDTTVDSLPGSLRLLGMNMEPDQSVRDSRVTYQDVINNKYRKLGQQSRDLSRPASLRSDIGLARVTTRNASLEGNHSRGDSAARNVQARRGHATSHVNFSKDRIIGRSTHRRTQSASTEDLIKESPYGDGVPPPSTRNIQHRLHVLKQRKGWAQSSHTNRPSRTTTLKPSIKTKVPSATSKGHLPSSSASVSKMNQKHSKRKAQLDVSTTTDSLIYSSPFGLDRDMPFPDLSVLSPAYAQSNHLSPIRSANTDGTLKEEELASSLSSLSSMTLETEQLTNEKLTRPPLIADHVSESTVGETARANAMLRRANRIMQNTQTSLNTSSHLEQQQSHSTESSDTEELLAGDQELMTRVQTRIQSARDTPSDPATQKMLDHFLEDCIQSSGKESPDFSEERTSEGPLESLKNMLFKLQDMASVQNVEMRGEIKSQQHEEPMSAGGKKNVITNSRTSNGRTKRLASSSKPPSPESSSSPSSVLHGAKDTTPSPISHSQSGIKNVSFQSQRDFSEEPGGQSLQRAMKHLSRLKTLVAMDTTSTSTSAARASSF